MLRIVCPSQGPVNDTGLAGRHMVEGLESRKVGKVDSRLDVGHVVSDPESGHERMSLLGTAPIDDFLASIRGEELQRTRAV